MYMVYLIHVFATRARHRHDRMEQPLHKKIEKQSNFCDSRWTFFNSTIVGPRKLLQRNLFRRDCKITKIETAKKFSVMLRKY